MCAFAHFPLTYLDGFRISEFVKPVIVFLHFVFVRFVEFNKNVNSLFIYSPSYHSKPFCSFS